MERARKVHIQLRPTHKLFPMRVAVVDASGKYPPEVFLNEEINRTHYTVDTPQVACVVRVRGVGFIPFECSVDMRTVGQGSSAHVVVPEPIWEDGEMKSGDWFRAQVGAAAKKNIAEQELGAG